MEQVKVKEYIPELPLDKIEVAEENVRKTQRSAGIEDLQHSIEKFGLIHPIIVIPDKGKYKVIVGQRRYLAFKGLKKTTIPALVVEPLDTTSQTIVSLGENIHRRELPYDDTIKVCDALYNKYTGTKSERIKKIARDLGFTVDTVSKYLAHRLVPPAVRALVEEGKLSEKKAYSITKSFWPDELKITEIAKRATRLTRSEYERALEAGTRKPAASVDEILQEAKTPRPVYELVIHLEPETGKFLEKIADSRRTDVENIVVGLIESMLKSEALK